MDIEIEDIMLEEEGNTAGTYESMIALAKSMAYALVNLRNGDPFKDVMFKAVDLHNKVEMATFPGSELESRLDTAKEMKLNLLICYQCPNREKGCPDEWHEYCITKDGEEYLHWFMANKMVTASGIWI